MHIPKLLQNSAIYTLVMILQKGISFFLLPVYTMFLSPADYGILGVTSSISSFLSMFITLGLGAAAIRFYFSHDKDEEYCRLLYGSVAAVILTLSIFIGGILIAAHKYILDPMAGNISFYPYLFLGVLNTIVTPMYVLYQDYLQAHQDGIKYGINSICCFLLNIGLILLMLIVFKLGVVGVLLAQFLNSVVFFGYVFISFLMKLKIRYNKLILKSCFKYSLPLLPHMLANWSNGTLDKLLVNGIRSEADAGMYNLGQQYSSVMSFMALAINNAYVPWFYDRVKDGKRGIIRIQQLSEFAVCALSFTALMLALFAQEILDVMISNPEYDGVWKIVPFIVFAYVFQGLYFFYVNVLFLKDTKIIFTITCASVAVNIILNLWLIPSFGYAGGAIAFMLTYLIQSIFALIVSSIKNKRIRFHWVLMYSIAFIALAISLSSLFLDFGTLWTAFVVKILMLGVFSLIIAIRYKSLIKSIYLKYVKKTVAY